MAAKVTGHLQKQAWIDRVLPPVEEVQPGLWSIPVEIPIRPLRYVLVYVLELRDGIAIIDAGWNDEKSYEALTAGLAKGGYAVSDIKDILITHVHPDHFGLAKRLREETGARITLHRAEATTLMIDPTQEVKWQMESDFHAIANGVPEEERQLMNRDVGEFRSFVDHHPPDVLVEDGQRLDLPGWELDGIWTPGHTPGHMCFVDNTRKVMFTGDHVLPRITPNISVHSSNPPDALAKYLDSLTKVGTIADELGELEGLPGHEYRYSGISDRTAELVEHHEERLAELVGVLRDQPGLTAWEVSQRLSWSRSWDTFKFPERRSALGESVSHIELLQQRGVVQSDPGETNRWRVVEKP
ncbi:MAG: MBL fold metallo-hydrolase [Cumulibacter sp.]